jgi:predicted DNA-binding protein
MVMPKRSVSLTQTIIDRLEAEGEKKGRSVSYLIREAVGAVYDIPKKECHEYRRSKRSSD